MKKHASYFIFACTMLLLTVTPVMGEILYSNPSLGTSATEGRTISPDGDTGYWLVVDDFSLSSASSIDSISFRAWHYPDYEVTQVNLTIYADSGGSPGTGIVAVPSMSTSGTDAGYSLAIFDVDDYTVTFDYLPLPAGTYWLGLSYALNGALLSSDFSLVYWEVNDSLSGTSSGRQYNSLTNSWTTISGDLVFTVNGTSTASVPEPTTLLLFGLGLVGLAGLRKCKK